LDDRLLIQRLEISVGVVARRPSGCAAAADGWLVVAWTAKAAAAALVI
jgi:hypothetical protein